MGEERIDKQNMEKSLYQASKDFHDACVNLFIVVCDHLGIDKIVKWLQSKLNH